jgi:hypothetical protein
MNPKEQHKESIAADAAELVGDIAIDGTAEGVVEVVDSIGGSALDLAGDLLGGIFD